jgi:type IV pilus assembly protein PilY1
MGTGNGLGAPRPIDVDGNGTTDVVYAGDLRGQMWKFDLTSADPLQWGVAGWNGGAVCNGAITPCEPLVAVTSPNRKAQPILVAPMWVAHPQGGLVLTFGTGQLLEDKDRRDTTTQTVYGIWDSSRYRRGASGVTAVHGPPIPAGRTRSSLVEQTYTGTVAQTADTFDRRTFSTSSRNPVAYSSTDASAPRGWFIDMANPGERLLTHPQLQQGNLVRFETQVPPPTPEEGYCASSAQSGQGYVQVLQGLTGQPSLQPPFISPDATLNLTNVSKVAFGNGDSVLLMSENEAVLLSGQLKGGAQDIGTQLRQQLILARLKAVVRTVDWRILP